METSAELLLFAAPEMGHLLSSVELGRRLVAINSQISIVILIPKLPVPDEKIDAFVVSLGAELRGDANSRRISLLELPPLKSESLNSADYVPLKIERLTSLCMPAVKQVFEERKIRRSIAGIVFDMFCTPMVDVAEELGIPSYLFYTSGADMLTFNLRMESLGEPDLPKLFAGRSPGSAPVKFPGFRNPVPMNVWPGVYLNKEMSLWPTFLGFASQYRKVKGILVNTFYELESELVHALAKDEQIPPVYPVGPILHLSRQGGGNGNNNDCLTEKPRNPVLSWLDEQPAKSVVFLCFGSKVSGFEKAQVEKLAFGLEQSGHRFLWSMRGSLDEVLPKGFLDRTTRIGKVIGWAPQTEVLGHMAVGAFVSHCGWNSTLESLWFGVPLVTWPLYAEQQLNSFVLVRELGIAGELKMDYEFDMRRKKGSVMVEAGEVEAAIRKMMEGEEGRAVKKKTQRMSFLARKAMEVDGSSYKSLSLYLEDVMKNIG